GQLWCAERMRRLQELVELHRVLAAIPEEVLRRRFDLQKWRPRDRTEKRINPMFCEWLAIYGSRVKETQSWVRSQVVEPAKRVLRIKSNDGKKSVDMSDMFKLAVSVLCEKYDYSN